MSSQKTEHYQLHKWEPGDDFLREEFNENFEKLDGAVGEKTGAVFGTYTGDGASSRTISLGFTPSAVLLCKYTGEMYRYPDTAGGLALKGAPLGSQDCGPASIKILSGGFCVYFSGYAYTNHDGYLYHYVAFV